MSPQAQSAQRQQDPANPERQPKLTLQVVARDGVTSLPIPPQRSAYRSLIAWLIAAALIVTAGGMAYRFGPGLVAWVSPNQTTVTQPQQATRSGPMTGQLAQGTVIGLGELVPAGGVIAIAAPFGAGDARIASFSVNEGDRVVKGSIIAALDSEPILQAAVATARANLDVQQAVLEQTKAARLANRDEAEAAAESARAVLRNAQAEFDRTSRLAARGVVPRATLDKQRATLTQAEREVDRTQTILSRFNQAGGSGLQDVVVAERRLAAAQSELARATSELEKAYIRAPATGTILSLDNQAGERPASSGIGTMANLEQMTAEVEVYQSSIGGVAVGNAVTLSSEALSTALTGKVSRIGLRVERQELVDSNPAANTDARVVKVYVTLDPDSSKRAQALTNLQVVARIQTAPAS